MKNGLLGQRASEVGEASQFEISKRASASSGKPMNILGVISKPLPKFNKQVQQEKITMNGKNLLKVLINSALGPFGLEVRRKATRGLRNSMQGALEHIKGLGFYPETVIDVGVAAGTFALYETFPLSKHVFVEPLEEFKPYLDDITTKFPNSEYIMAAAAQRPGNVTINVHPDLSGSSLYLEDEDSNVNGVPRVVPATTLDHVCKERKLEGPYLIKVDVQGAELDVLGGGIDTLGDAE